MGFICSKEISKKHIMEEGVNLLEQYANHIGGFFHSCGLNRLLSTDRNDLWISDYKGQVFELEIWADIHDNPASVSGQSQHLINFNINMPSDLWM